jgi:hypothetical protein
VSLSKGFSVFERECERGEPKAGPREKNCGRGFYFFMINFCLRCQVWDSVGDTCKQRIDMKWLCSSARDWDWDWGGMIPTDSVVRIVKMSRLNYKSHPLSLVKI